MTSDSGHAFSVVIPTYQRRASLERVLTALSRQEWPADALELLVVSDGGDDGSVEMARSLRLPFASRVLEQANQGPAAARNLGVANARHPFVLFLDDDVVPDPRLVAEHARGHGAADNRVVIGPMLEPPVPLQPWVRWESRRLAEQYRAMVAGEWAPTPWQLYTGVALACSRPGDRDVPLSRYSLSELTVEVASQLEAEHAELVAPSRSAIWRLLIHDALRPWRYRSWIFPRDPDFLERAGPVLDLYACQWQGRPLWADEYVLSADEKTSIQVRRRLHSTLPIGPHQAMRVDHEYERAGVLQYLAAWDVHRAVVFGRCEPKTGKAAFARLVGDVMDQEPYRSARRVFWIVDNGSSHRGERAAEELRARYPRIVIVHTPTYASWLNQIEIYFSIIQRKVLKPNDYTTPEELEQAIHAFGRRYSALGKLFAWCFTRQDLERRLREPLLQPEAPLTLASAA